MFTFTDNVAFQRWLDTNTWFEDAEATVRRLLWYPIALLLLAACSDGRAPCIHTTIRSRLVSGHITYAFGSGVPETHTLSPADTPVTLPAGSGACAASTPQTDVWPDGYESSGGMMVGCEPTEGSVRIIVGPVQPRLLALDQPNELSTYGASITGAGCDSYCAQVVVTANVTRAQGGAAPYPSAVTADYLREVSVHIEFNAGIVTTTASGRLCVAPSGSADLVFVETAADAVTTQCAYASLPSPLTSPRVAAQTPELSVTTCHPFGTKNFSRRLPYSSTTPVDRCGPEWNRADRRRFVCPGISRV